MEDIVAKAVRCVCAWGHVSVCVLEADVRGNDGKVER